MVFDYSKHAKKINLGCGFDKKDGFLNVDLNAIHHPDLVCDVSNLQVLPSSYYEYALANDILEHIPRLKTINVLKEWNRILVTDGELDLQVPNVSGLLSLLDKKENQTPVMHEKLLQCLYGTQAYNGDFHYTGFTDILLEKMLNDAGFSIEKIETRDEWLFKVLARKVADRQVDSIFFLSDEEFVRAIYSRFLGRKADQDGFGCYLGIIKSGIVREAVVDSIKKSDEHLKFVEQQNKK